MPRPAAPTGARPDGDRARRESRQRPLGRPLVTGGPDPVSRRAGSPRPPHLGRSLHRSTVRSRGTRSARARARGFVPCAGDHGSCGPARRAVRPRSAARVDLDRSTDCHQNDRLLIGRHPGHPSHGSADGRVRWTSPSLGTCCSRRSDPSPCPSGRACWSPCPNRPPVEMDRGRHGVRIDPETWDPMLRRPRRGSAPTHDPIAVSWVGCGDWVGSTLENDDERHPMGGARCTIKSGGVLLSQGISPQVPSALRGLTSVFGMGTGVTLSPWPPETCCQLGCTQRTPEQARANVKRSKPSAD